MTRIPENRNPDPTNIDDPRITAYALGELSAEDAGTFESELVANLEWQDSVASVKEAADLLKQALCEEPMIGLTQAHRDSIESRIGETQDLRFDPPAKPSLTSVQKVAWLAIGIAAALFFVFSIALPVPTDKVDGTRLVAKSTDEFEPAFPGPHLVTDLRNSVSNGLREDMLINSLDDTSEEGMVTLTRSGDEIIITGTAAPLSLAELGHEHEGAAFQGFNPSGVVNIDFAKVTSEPEYFKDDGNYIASDFDAPPIDLSNVEERYVRTLDGTIDFNAADYAGVEVVVYDNGSDDLELSPNLADVHVIGGDSATVSIADDPLDDQGGEWVPYYNYEGGTSVLFGDGHASFLKNPLQQIDNDNMFSPSGVDQVGRSWISLTSCDQGRIQAGWFSLDTDGDGIPDAAAARESTTERYAHIRENAFKLVRREPLSTFSIDVDTASYSNVRRFLNSGRLPPPDAVRIEEFINYFSYDYPQPEDDAPFSINVDVADCPWNRAHRLARIGLKGYEIANEDRPYSNLVFLIDVSGSMASPNKLTLLKQSMRLLIDELDAYDRVAIVVYAGASGLVLDSTTCDQKDVLIDALDNLQPGGSTNGAAGIELAYELATKNFIEDGTNRVILATDGDFNVGMTSEVALLRLIEEKAKTGVFLTALGFGGGNYQDATLELLADKGNGNYAYIDSVHEAERVLVEQMGGTLVTIAKDVKIQVEFNPAEVGAYRLIGYENRMLAKEDFNDDTKDAGEIGAGHTVTALYEIIPAGEPVDFPDVDPLKYQWVDPTPTLVEYDELMTVKVRYKLPDEDKSTRMEHPVFDRGTTIEDAADDFRFAASVASFGMLLRHSAYRGETTFEQVLELAENNSGEERSTAREGFIELVNIASGLLRQTPVESGSTDSDE